MHDLWGFRARGETRAVLASWERERNAVHAVGCSNFRRRGGGRIHRPAAYCVPLSYTTSGRPKMTGVIEEI